MVFIIDLFHHKKQKSKDSKAYTEHSGPSTELSESQAIRRLSLPIHTSQSHLPLEERTWFFGRGREPIAQCSYL